MTKPLRIIRNIAIGLAALIIVIVVAAIVIVHTDWFPRYVKQKIITSTEESTGGKVDVGSFAFDLRHMQAVVTNFVIHGKEPAGAAPFLSARRVQVDIRLFTSIHHLLDVAYLGIEQPQANVIVLPDGQTNIPSPKQKSSSNTTPLETVVDLAVDHFDLSNGAVTVSSQKQPLNIRGNNLQVQLWYNVLNQGYHGQLSFQPLYIASGQNNPVDFTVTLPVSLQRDRIEFKNASISTAQSSIRIDASIESMRDPKISAHIKGNIALLDVKNAVNLPVTVGAKNAPANLDVDGNALVTSNRIEVKGLHLGLGQSDLEASGTLKDPLGNGSLQFKSRLILGELGRLAKLPDRPEGTVLLNGKAKLDASNNYQVTGNVQAEHLSIQQGSERIQNINLYSAIQLDPHNLNLEGFRLAAFGGELAGNASLQDFRRYRLDAKLRGLDLGAAARTLGEKQFPYSGIVSGPLEAAGDLKLPGTSSVVATAGLTISPGKRGIPVSGRLDVAYNGAADDLRLDNSYVALPHTRLAFHGSAGKRLNVSLTTTDLHDLLAGTSLSSKPPVALEGGQINFTGVVSGLSSPRITGHLAATRFSVEGRQFDKLDADLSLSNRGAGVRNGVLARNNMLAQFSANVGLSNWKALPREPVTADATIRNGDLADIVALVGQPSTGYSGTLEARLHLSGTVGNPQGAANLMVTNGALHGEPFDRLQAQVNLSDQLVTVSNASLEAGAARVNLNAEFQHPRDSFTTGRLHAHVQSNQVNLAEVKNLQKQQPDTAGEVQLNVDVTGNLTQANKGAQKTEFQLTSVNGNASARGLRFQGENYGDFSATAQTSGSTVSYNATSDFAGSNLHVNGSTQLSDGYPTTADATIRNLAIEPVLKIAKRSDIPAKGNLSGTAHFSGTIQNPQGRVNVDLANAVLYDQPIDHVRARVAYLSRSIDIQQFEVVSGPSRIDLTASYQHPPGNLQEGNVQFRMNSNRLDLAKIKFVQDKRPGLGGIVQMASDGSAEVHPTAPRLTVQRLDANVKATGILNQGKNFGDATLTANSAGNRLNFKLDSNLAGAAIHGEGNAQLTSGYPVDARLSFQNVTWTRIHELVGAGSGQPARFEAATDGQITVHGPIMNVDQLGGELRITRLQLNNIPAPGVNGPRPVMLQNQGPISATLDRGVVRIESAHVAGPQTDFQATGTIPLHGLPMNIAVSGNVNLAVLQNFDQDITSSGTITLATTVRGTVAQPLVNGTLELKAASFNYASLPNGIANANGTVVFNGNSASIRNLTAESGGGKLTLSGFAAKSDKLRFGLRANGSTVRVRVQQGVSIVIDANVNLSGTTDNSLLSGTVTIDRVSYAPRTDLGSLLTAATPPVEAAAAPSPLQDNMRLDIDVRTSDATAVQASLAENLQIDANLRVRGTVSHPGVVGRVNITEGKLVFFGSTYNVNTGTIGFFNPVRITPILDLSLETSAKGVDVVLRVTGPVDNMKLSYTSDPPLQFQEIVSLLAAGTVPTSDPTLLATQPSPPPQNLQQRGESALLSKAVAEPIAGQLQRVFGVSQLKIDPTVAGGSQVPTARLTLQQRITSNLTFTYITDVTATNSEIIRMEWTINPRWSAMATRDENGIFSINLLYKKQVR